MSEPIKAEFEVDFKEGKKIIKTKLKQPYEIEECEENKYIILNLLNGDNYRGFYKGIDDDTIMIGALNDGQTIGIKIKWLENYFEQIN